MVIVELFPGFLIEGTGYLLVEQTSNLTLVLTNEFKYSRFRLGTSLAIVIMLIIIM